MSNLELSVDTAVQQVSTPTRKKKYKNPYWSNKDNRHLIVTIEQEDGTTSMASIMDPDNTNKDMKEVLEQFTEEEIDANTKEGLDRRNENIKLEMERRESQAVRNMQETLFNCKLGAFEVDAIKNSKNTELKRMIRKSKTIMEVQAYATILLMKELENAATD